MVCAAGGGTEGDGQDQMILVVGRWLKKIGEKIIGPEYYSSYGNSQVGKGAVDRFKVR